MDPQENPVETGKKILVVEDESSLLQAITIKLTDSGYAVLSAKNGKDGLGKAKQNHPDLILLDVGLPVMDGMAMLHELRQDAWGKTVLVIIFTNFDVTDDRIEQVVDEHPSYYLMKSSTTLEQVLEKVRELLE